MAANPTDSLASDVPRPDVPRPDIAASHVTVSDVHVAQRWVGRPLPRREDPALLTGWARYLADLRRPRLAHVGFVRSTEAHADIVAVRCEDAKNAPGVVAVLTSADLARCDGSAVPPQPSTHNLWTRETPYYALARDRVRYVGEDVVAVVAEHPAAVADALAQVEVDYAGRPVVTDTAGAVAPGSAVVFDGWPDNVAGTFDVEMGDGDAAFARAEGGS